MFKRVLCTKTRLESHRLHSDFGNLVVYRVDQSASEADDCLCCADVPVETQMSLSVRRLSLVDALSFPFSRVRNRLVWKKLGV